jgi:2-deoxy-D-gluconate 3-dehydrogenase
MEIFDLKGETAIVTGGNQGIGFAISKGLAQAGATVIIANRRAAQGEHAAETLRSQGLNAIAVETDVADMSSLKQMVSIVIEKFEKIDILVNNAGVIVRKPPEDITDKDWNYMFDINLKGLFFCCQIVGKEMIKRKKGKIINITSDASKLAVKGLSAYATSKAAIAHLTRNLALEWAKYGIRVNALGPGPTRTEMNRVYFEKHPQSLEDKIASMPVGRMGDPLDYGGAAVFLASKASEFIVGQNLLVDGGSTIS